MLIVFLVVLNGEKKIIKKKVVCVYFRIFFVFKRIDIFNFWFLNCIKGIVEIIVLYYDLEYWIYLEEVWYIM